MAEELDFHGDQAARVADKVDEIGDRIKAVLSTMSAAESSLWGCWGSGDTGHGFARGEDNDGYIPGSENMHTVLDSACGFLSGEDGYAPAFRAAAKSLRAMEERNRVALEQRAKGRK
ncbi:hypothetical protein [Nocardia sp. NBC_00416]|uniref:hypothetical protein n=1 Tax=Nocardia sp. NBC_00416 TaxID=2975991 RepID=UPI002E1B051B